MFGAYFSRNISSIYTETEHNLWLFYSTYKIVQLKEGEKKNAQTSLIPKYLLSSKIMLLMH